MSIIITETIEYDIIQQLENLATCDNLNDFEAILRFIDNSRCENYREILIYILEEHHLRIKYSEKYIRLLEHYSLFM
jgi:hypothetical protein